VGMGDCDSCEIGLSSTVRNILACASIRFLDLCLLVDMVWYGMV
jgi:hypothetical protein